MGSDWWQFDESVRECILRKIKELNYIPSIIYLSDNWSAGKYAINKEYPDIKVIVEKTDKYDMKIE